MTVTFDVVNGSSLARTDVSGSESDLVTKPELTVYPVPTSDEFGFSLKGVDAERVEVVLMNLEGKVVYNEVSSAAQLTDKSVSMDRLGLSSGIYLLKVNTGEVQFIREVIKE